MIQVQEPIRLATSQMSQASNVLTRAFHDDPMMQYIIPEDAKRPRRLAWFFGTANRYGRMYGEVHITADVDGVAIWLTPGNTIMTFERMFRAGMLAFPLKLGLAAFGRFMNIVGYAEKLHKQVASGPHWYLLGLGVEPARQGKGIGGALIQPVLARADDDGLPCYLETMNEKNLPFYRKHGFEVAFQGEVPKGGPAIWTMLRESRR